MFVYPDAVVNAADQLSSAGLSDYAVARRLGISRSAVQLWRSQGFRPRPAPAPSSWTLAEPSYAYLLGLYLGDGCLYRGGRAIRPTLDLALDARYPRILLDARDALGGVFPGSKIRTYAISNGSCVHLRVTHAALHMAFPHHGVGKKHERPISLRDWQLVLTRRRPDAFLRGLIHSDGSRCINRFKTKLPSGRVAAYEYVRYFFSNYSADIRRLFCEHCDLLGIHWTQSNPRNISIARRESVDLLDQIVGPKA